MDSKHTFLHLYNATETQTLFLEANEDTEAQKYEDSTLKFSFSSSITWEIPIKVTFFECTLSELRFAQSSLRVAYKIGSGDQLENLPDIKQTPDCGFKSTKLEVKNVVSSLAQEQLFTTFKIDESALTLNFNTNDASLAEQSAEFQILLVQDVFGTDVTLKVEVTYDLDPAKFDTEGYEVTPLSCTDSDASWSMALPKVDSVEPNAVVIEMVTTESGFTFNGVDTVTIDADAEFVCPDTSEVQLEFKLRQGAGGQSNSEKIAIKIERIAVT